MSSIPRFAVAALVVAGVAGCNYNSNLNSGLTTQATLKAAVGTLNDVAGTIFYLATKPASTAGLPSQTYLNVVTTFRNQNGLSAFPNPNSATLTGPGSINVTLGTLSSYGNFPFSNAVVGQPPAYTPAVGGFNPGYSTGFTFTNIAPAAGGYTVTETSTANGATLTYTATPSLPAGFTTLGPEGNPVYAVAAGTGGGTFTITKPGGVTESLIAIFNDGGGSCNVIGSQVATVETLTNTGVVPAATLAAGNYCAAVVGADYPLVEAGPPTNVQVSPVITGSGGTSDLTASGFTAFTQT